MDNDELNKILSTLLERIEKLESRKIEIDEVRCQRLLIVDRQRRIRGLLGIANTDDPILTLTNANGKTVLYISVDEEDGPKIRMHASESDKALVDIYLKANGGGIALRSNAEEDEKELMIGSTDQGSMIVFLEGDNITKMIDDLENPE